MLEGIKHYSLGQAALDEFLIFFFWIVFHFNDYLGENLKSFEDVEGLGEGSLSSFIEVRQRRMVWLAEKIFFY